MKITHLHFVINVHNCLECLKQHTVFVNWRSQLNWQNIFFHVISVIVNRQNSWAIISGKVFQWIYSTDFTQYVDEYYLLSACEEI